MTLTRGALGLSLVAAGCLLAACGSDSDCEDTRTCGEPSTGGTGGAGTGGGGSGGTGAAGTGATGGTTGGTGGTGGAPQCTSSTECDDGKACNGQETCESGSCKAGTPIACENPDAAHCEAACVEAQGTGSCKVTGKDADGDGHLDAACATSASLADDCDDTQKSVYPGSAEICDGLDNDCDGKDELDKGMPLGGGATDFVKNTGVNAMSPAIAWSTAKQYGVVWTDDRDGNNEIYFARMSPDGIKVGSPPIDELRVSNHAASSTVPRIAWGNNVYGIAWQDPHGASTDQIYFRAMDTTGAGKSAELQVSGASAKAETPDIAALPSGWVVVWADRRSNTNGEIYARLLNADGTTNGSEKQIGSQGGTNILPRVASNGTELLVTWSHRDFTGGDTTPNQVKVLRLGLDLSVKAEQVVSAATPAAGTGANTSSVAATSTGWAFGWREYSTTTQLRMHEIKADLTSDCTPATIPVVDLDGSGGIAVRGTSRLVSYREGMGLSVKVKALRFKNNCASPVTFDLGGVDDPVTDLSRISVAWGDSSAVIVWADQSSGLYTLRRWAAGPNLCDAPKP